MLRHDRPLVEMGVSDVRLAYRRWAPVYDKTFGKFAEAAVRQVTAYANNFTGKLLEAGVGTGLALPHYAAALNVTGIDLSPHMLARARLRADKAGKGNIDALLEMDAAALKFADATFDVAVAMFVMTVVPEPGLAMAELARVTKPGGTILICNHFSKAGGFRGAVERHLSRYSTTIGFRSEFPVKTVLGESRLRLVRKTPMKPFGFFTMLEFQKRP